VCTTEGHLDRSAGTDGDTAAGVLRTVALYSFAGWAYIAANAVAHPESLPWPLTHLAGWPREDTFGVLCFGVSFLAAVAARLLEGRR
jgi:hypothetical protein